MMTKKRKTKRLLLLCSGVLNRELEYVNTILADQDCETSDSVASCNAQALSSGLCSIVASDTNDGG